MAQEEKELLLKDLCARLPYGVKIHHGIPTLLISIKSDRDGIKIITEGSYGEHIFDIEDMNPYLRPLSGMTDEEFEELKEYSGLKYEQLDLVSFQNGTYKCLDFYLSEIPSYVVILVFDWLNAHHFDYRGLIERGLALEAPEGMY